MASQGMFGPSGAEVELALREQQKQEAMQYASMPAGRGPVALMAQAGQGIGRAIEGAAGYQDPRVAKAKLLEEAKMEVDSSGADLMADPKGYYESAFKALQSRGLMDEAMGVRQLMMEEESQAALNAKNLRGNSKGYGMSGNIMFNKDDGTREVVDEYQGSAANLTPITLSPPGSTYKGTGQEITVMPGSPEAIQAIKDGYVDTSKLPGPARPRDKITIEMGARSEYLDKMGEAQAAGDSEVFAAADNAPKLLESSFNIRQALENPDLIVGPGADVRLAFAKLMNVAGADNNETIAQTQILMGRLADTTLQSIPTSNLGGGQGFTERDKEFLISAKAGNINWDRDALEYMAYLNEKAAYNFVNARNKRIEGKDPEIRDQLALAGVDMRLRPLPKLGKAPVWKPKKPTQDKNTGSRKIKSGWTKEEVDALTDDEYKDLMGE